METTTSFNVSFNNSSRIYQPTDDYKSLLSKIRYTYGALSVLLVPVIIVANLVLIITILNNINLRKKFRYQVMVSIASADLLIGLISCPVRGDFWLTMNRDRHSCVTLIVFTVIENYVQMFVGTWGIVTINFEYLLSMFRVKLPELSPLKQKLSVALILALPWSAMIFLVLPVAYAHAREDVDPFQWCYLYIPLTAKEIIVSFTFAIPSIIIVSQSIVMTVYHCLHRNNRTPSLVSSTEITTSPWVFVVAGAVTVGLVGIEQSGHMATRVIRKVPRKVRLGLFSFAIFISDSKSAATPLMWFAFPELRNAFMDLLKKLLCRQVTNIGGNVIDTSVGYKNFSDESA